MLSQSQAQELFEHNGFLIVQGMPRGSYVALDGLAAVSDHGFEGYKFLPAGVHMFVWRAGSEDIGVRGVFLHRFSQGNVVLRRYDPSADTWRSDDELCLLYTSDAADEEDSVDLGGCRIIKKKKKNKKKKKKKKKK